MARFYPIWEGTAKSMPDYFYGASTLYRTYRKLTLKEKELIVDVFHGNLIAFYEHISTANIAAKMCMCFALVSREKLPISTEYIEMKEVPLGFLEGGCITKRGDEPVNGKKTTDYFNLADDFSVHLGRQIVIRKLTETEKCVNANKEYINVREYTRLTEECNAEDIAIERGHYPAEIANYRWLHQILGRRFVLDDDKYCTIRKQPMIIAEGCEVETKRINMHIDNLHRNIKPKQRDCYQGEIEEKSKGEKLYFAGCGNNCIYIRPLSETERTIWDAENALGLRKEMGHTFKKYEINDRCWCVIDMLPIVYEMNYDGDVCPKTERLIKNIPKYIVAIENGRELVIKLGSKARLFFRDVICDSNKKFIEHINTNYVAKFVDCWLSSKDKSFAKKYSAKRFPDFYCVGVPLMELPELSEEWPIPIIL